MNQSGNDLSSEQRIAVVLGLLAVVCGILAVALVFVGTAAGYTAMAVCILAAFVLLGAAGARLHTTPTVRKNGGRS